MHLSDLEVRMLWGTLSKALQKSSIAFVWYVTIYAIPVTVYTILIVVLRITVIFVYGILVKYIL